MRIVQLTPEVESGILRARSARDRRAERVAERICADVRRRGNRALLAWARQLDGLRLHSPDEIWVPPSQIRAARDRVAPALLRAIEHAARNIHRVAAQQVPRAWRLRVEFGVEVRQAVRPLDCVACYVPGGRFSLLSTLLMAAIPAQVAGVRRIVIACPAPGDAVLAAADFLGLREIARIGGAQAIAAFAYGTQTIPRVDKICGPGNRFVTAAKKLVNDVCAIDLPAGPTEAIVFATKGDPRFIAADLLAQAEHDPDAVVLAVVTSASLARSVRSEGARQLSELPQSSPSRRSLNRNGAILLAASPAHAIRFVNHFAPEHLSLPGGEAHFLRRIKAAGSIFLGPWSAQPLGDYCSGTNHVLPTAGWARARGGLSAADFVRCISVQKVTRAGFARLAPVALELARAEGLPAHARAVITRQSAAERES